VSRDDFLRSARSERRATEEASSYLTEESEDGLTPSNSTEQQKAESVSPPETSTNGFVPLDISIAEEIEISGEYKISSIVVADGSPIVDPGTGVPEQLGPAAEEASPHLEERVTQGDVPSDAKESENRIGSGIPSPIVVGGSPTAVQRTGVPLTPTTQRRIPEDNVMPYAYPKYSNHRDAAAHVKQFRSIWVVNHGTQGLSLLEREQPMIVEFQLSLEGQAARWYAQQDIGTFATFQVLVDKFLELFQVKIDPTEVLKE
jgi:hypothetical protein